MQNVFEEMSEGHARRYIPDGSCTLSKRPDAFPSNVWSLAKRQCGPVLQTGPAALIFGSHYVDLVCALGALVAGNHRHVVEAVKRQMDDGAIFSLPSLLECPVAERLCRVIPCAEQVKFLKTGSESVSASVRIARIATESECVAVLRGHYHGWHDWHGVTAAKHPGIPDWMDRGVAVYDTLDELLENVSGEPEVYAAILIEPERVEIDNPGGLARLRAFCDEANPVLVFDEMLSGGRLRVGGAQELFGVTPDLATFGKAFGGGLPLAFVCGRRELMQHAWPVSGTFSGDALALAACDAMLDLYSEQEHWSPGCDGTLIQALWTAGAQLRYAFRDEDFADLGIVTHGHDPRFWVTFGDHVDRRLAMSVVVQECARQGVLMHQAVVFASAALEAQHISVARDAIIAGLTMVQRGVRDGNLASLVEGDTYKDSVR